MNKPQDPWSKGSQAGSNVPETTKSKLLAHLMKANDARGLPRKGKRPLTRHTVLERAKGQPESGEQAMGSVVQGQSGRQQRT